MPEIAIIGRQNVGKSALFNALLKERVSITYDSPGVTRDLVRATANWGEGRWRLTDFPGLETLDRTAKENVKKLEYVSMERAKKQINNFQLLLWVVSVHGLSSYDYELAKILRKNINQKNNIWLVVNYVDDVSKTYAEDDFYALGFEPIFFVSALNKRNISSLREAIKNFFKANPIEEVKEIDTVRFSLIGKPNAGKSTLFNSFLQKDQAMISDIPGTTRDSLKESFIYHGKTFEIIDTAGMRRRNALSDSVDFFSQKRSEKATDEADIVFYLIDPIEGFDRQNKIIIQQIEKSGKPMILLVNKSDLLDEKEKKNLRQEIEATKKKYWDFPFYFISALEKSKTDKILEKALRLLQSSQKTISSHRLNELLQTIKSHPVLEGQKVKLKYIATKEKNSRLIVFANRIDIPENAKRYLKKKLADEIGWHELPVTIDFRKAPIHQRESFKK